MKKLTIFLLGAYIMLGVSVARADIIINEDRGVWNVDPYGPRIKQRPQVQTGVDAFLQNFFAFQALANSRQACCVNSRVNYCDVSRQRVVCSNGYYSSTCMC